LGSQYYVTELRDNNQEEFKKIACNLNFDMLGSPNFFRGVFNGSAGAPSIAIGSGTIQSLWEKYFQDNRIAYSLTEFNGRSDYGPFIANGIPAGGLKAGAEVIKSIAERDKFGGFAGAPYDVSHCMFASMHLSILTLCSLAITWPATRSQMLISRCWGSWHGPLALCCRNLPRMKH
jgi:Zn-dependent M28 family amino/carboxypeptidase